MPRSAFFCLAIAFTLLSVQCAGPRNPETGRSAGAKQKVQTPDLPQVKAKYSNVLIKNVPHVRQKPDFCGEACVEMVLRKLGKQGTQNDVFNLSGVDPAEGRGTHAAELVRALKRIGFKTGPVWTRVDVTAG